MQDPTTRTLGRALLTGVTVAALSVLGTGGVARAAEQPIVLAGATGTLAPQGCPWGDCVPDPIKDGAKKGGSAVKDGARVGGKVVKKGAVKGYRFHKKHWRTEVKCAGGALGGAGSGAALAGKAGAVAGTPLGCAAVAS